ncbi:NADPH-dependent FMN reductase [Glycomyces harbinensis]|uniref:NAD(P)H-dependent FMN reductase n=1 Tax=Glycomyces harbinensis TaxID=58114 RepID=A0A1G6W017_9ACTN|nr:NAD(P)H-dependent oxidoreductase [Glycomyces harbinensis]SDD59124.1 NAD(P)H-dependent FMN reductase [Glycomyces harbinensis]
MTATRPLRLLVLCASARTGSVNRALAEAVVRRLAAAGAEADLTGLGDFPVPLYDADLQGREGVPEGAVRLAERLRDHDGLVIVSPEYNYSMPGSLKNLFDWVSRIKPWPTAGVDGLLMSASPGPVGGHRGLLALRVPLEGIGMRLHPTMFSLAKADKAFDASGGLADPGDGARLDAVLDGYLTVVEAVTRYPAARAALAARA